MAIDAGLARKLLDWPQLDAAAASLRGQVGADAARLMVRLADGRRESPAESELAYVCHCLGYQLEPQVQLRGASGAGYRVDNVIVGSAVILEYDGRGKYTDQSAILQEKAREDDLRAAGWDFVRAGAQCLRHPSRLDSLIRAALARSEGPPPLLIAASSPRPGG